MRAVWYDESGDANVLQVGEMSDPEPGAGALVLAEFGGPVWVFAVLLAWLLTFGLPTLVAVLLLAWFWPGPSFQAYLLSAVLLALLFQWSAVFGFRWGITRRRISPR